MRFKIILYCRKSAQSYKVYGKYGNLRRKYNTIFHNKREKGYGDTHMRTAIAFLFIYSLLKWRTVYITSSG